MNRTEQKSEIRTILASIDDLKNQLTEKQTDFAGVLTLANELSAAVESIDASDSFDLDEFKDNLLNEVVGEDVREVYDAIYDLQSEIEDYISELSESRAEVMEDKYADLQTVLDTFDLSDQDYADIDELLENIDEAVGMLKDMLL